MATGPTLKPASTLICVPVMVRDADAALREAGSARLAGADLVEFRIDEFFTDGEGSDHLAAEIERIVGQCPLPCIVTCRSSAESGGFGGYDGGEDARVSLYERLGTGDHAPAYLDFEWSALSRSANIRQKVRLAVRHDQQLRSVTPGLILSTHDFQGRPADLTRRVLAMQGESAATIIKIAFKARSLRDNLELFDLLRERDRPTIGLTMGEFGLLSRVLAPKFGGFLTFAALRPAATTAPGQPTVAELLGKYRFRSIGPRTRVYGVMGWPVGHSLSPLVHNAAFERLGHDGVYLPLPAPAGGEGASTADDDLLFKSTLLPLIDYSPLDLSGLSVTLPHKERLVRLAREQGWMLDAASQATGSANTLVIDRTRGAVSARVANTDIAAAVDSLRDATGDLKGRRVAVVGAGGVGRAIAWGLAAEGAHVLLYAREARKVDAAAREVSERLPAGSGVISGRELQPGTPIDPVDACVNATPVGMMGGPDPSGVAFTFVGTPVVFDTVYNPIRTPLLARATEAGCRTVDGVSMFVRQAVAQARLFTGREDADLYVLFDRLVREELAESRSEPRR